MVNTAGSKRVLKELATSRQARYSSEGSGSARRRGIRSSRDHVTIATTCYSDVHDAASPEVAAFKSGGCELDGLRRPGPQTAGPFPWADSSLPRVVLTLRSSGEQQNEAGGRPRG